MCHGCAKHRLKILACAEAQKQFQKKALIRRFVKCRLMKQALCLWIWRFKFSTGALLKRLGVRAVLAAANAGSGDKTIDIHGWLAWAG